MSQIIMDFWRWQDNLFIDKTSLKEIFKELSISSGETQEKENVEKYRKVLRRLIQAPCQSEDNLNALTEILHQGALITALEHQIFLKLATNGLSPQNISGQQTTKRRFDLTTMPNGFIIKEHIECTGKIVDMYSPEKARYESSQAPLYKGVCFHEITIDDNGVKPKFIGHSLRTPSRELDELFNGKFYQSQNINNNISSQSKLKRSLNKLKSSISECLPKISLHK